MLRHCSVTASVFRTRSLSYHWASPGIVLGRGGGGQIEGKFMPRKNRLQTKSDRRQCRNGQKSTESILSAHMGATVRVSEQGGDWHGILQRRYSKRIWLVHDNEFDATLKVRASQIQVDPPPPAGEYDDGTTNGTAVNTAAASTALVPTTPTGDESPSSFTVKELHEQFDDPDPSWPTERLGVFAKGESERIIYYGKRLAGHVFLLGKALEIAFEKVRCKGYGHWGKFLKKYAISDVTAWRARELYKRAAAHGHSIKDVAGMEIDEAYRQYKISKKKGNSKKTQQQQREDPPPPPKEQADSLSAFLAKVVLMLEPYKDKAAFIKEDKDSPEHCLKLTGQVIAGFEKIAETIRHYAK